MKYITSILLMTLTIALMIGAIIYLSNRFTLYFPYLQKKSWLWIFSSLLILSLLGMIAFSTTSNPLGRLVFILGGIICSLLLFMLLANLITDLFNLIFRFSVGKRALFSIGLVVVLIAIGFWNAYSIKIKEISIPIQGLSKEIRALHLTDIHLGNYWGKNQAKRIVSKVNELKPDVIFNTGDMFDSKAHFGKKEDVLEPFKSQSLPHYFVYGNHDEHVGTKTVIQQMRNANINVLLNEIVFFGELQLIGLNNMIPDKNSFDPHANPNSETIEQTLNSLDVDKQAPTIVLHHRPEGVKYMQGKGADLLLSGHTHAGQIFPFTLIAKLMFGYNSGAYKYEDMDIYVSEGIGAQMKYLGISFIFA
ncbi:MAG: metallophosphoesterase [Bacteroidales bacterium]|nr:metallophosphoesterase [Bacteroidales bacterium]MDD4703309.1 metallophosphoesterase [Bacteroidales bacterium]